MRTQYLSVFLLEASLLVNVATAQPITSPQIDALVQRALTTFDVPGIAVAVVKDGKVVHMKGYGVRSLKTRQPVDENTLFGIASNSKAFTTAALGILMDEGKLTWDDKVIDYIPWICSGWSNKYPLHGNKKLIMRPNHKPSLSLCVFVNRQLLLDYRY